MRIAIQTYGTEGDLAPHHELARGLAARGHDVTFAYSPVADHDPDRFASPGVEVRVVGDLGLDPAETRDLRRRAEDRGRHYALFEYRRTVLRPLLPEVHHAATDLARDHDVLIRHAVLYPAGFAAVAADTPCIIAQPAPLPQVGQAEATGPRSRLAGLVRRRSILAGVAVDAMLGLPQFVKATGVRPAFRGQSLLTRSTMTLIHASPVLVGDVPGRRDRVHVTGQIDPVPTNGLPAEIEDFLAAGDPPVLLNPGSVAFGSPRLPGVVASVVAAARDAGRRLVVQVPPEAHPDAGVADVLRVDFVNYRELLPRCAAVVHHGGAGTTHAVVKAGRPSVVLPHVADQHYWADRLHHLGAAPAAVDSDDHPALAGAIRAVLDDDRFQRRAAALADRMRGENGLARAVELVEGVGAGT